MKRLYKTVAVTPVPGGFGVLLDARPLRSPAKRDLILPEAVARSVAAEWAAQGDIVRPASMPHMRLAATAIDRVAPARDEVVAMTAAHAATDLLCYRAEAPADLVARQAAAWQPVLDWARLRFDAPLRVACGIMPAAQDETSLRALHAVVAGLDLLTLTALADLTGLTGSLILALALWQRRLDAAATADLALLDELYQAERWGADDAATERRQAVGGEIAAIAGFLALLAS